MWTIRISPKQNLNGWQLDKLTEHINPIVRTGWFAVVVEDDEAAPDTVARPAIELTDEAVVAAVLAVAAERRAVLDQLRVALSDGSDVEALMLARQLVNLPKGDALGSKTAVH
jgi:hypothetical protein